MNITESVVYPAELSSSQYFTYVPESDVVQFGRVQHYNDSTDVFEREEGIPYTTAFGRRVSVTVPALSDNSGAEVLVGGDKDWKPFDRQTKRRITGAVEAPKKKKGRNSHGAADSRGFSCPIIGCTNREGGHTRLVSANNWYDHVMNKHGEGYLLDGKRYGGTQELGEAVLARQGTLCCGIDGCKDSSKFTSFHHLGNHLIHYHFDVLDAQPLNGLYRSMSRSEASTLSGLKAPWSLGKRYQTRHGNGFFCADHPDEKLSQTPEGLGKHWQKAHLNCAYFCPVRACTDAATGVRLSFDTPRKLYGHHMAVHMQNFAGAVGEISAKATLPERKKIGSGEGWLQCWQLDFSPYYCEGRDFEHYLPVHKK